MIVRGTFESSLDELKANILEMGRQVEDALQQSIEGFAKNNKKMLDGVIQKDRNINLFEIDINEKVTLMIVKQQPVASDLISKSVV